MSESSVGAALFARVGGVAETMDAEDANDTLLPTSDASLKGITSLRKRRYVNNTMYKSPLQIYRRVTFLDHPQNAHGEECLGFLVCELKCKS